MSSLSQTDPTDDPGAQAYVLRKNGNYLVVKAEVTQDVPAMQLKAGDGYGYCYFFKKVK